MTVDRTSGVSLALTLGIHIALGLALGTMVLSLKPVPQVPMLIEVTMAGTSAPYSMSEGEKNDTGAVVTPKGDAADEKAAMTPEQLKQWQAQQRKQLIRELAQSREKFHIGATTRELRKENGGLSEGRGAGEFGQPGSPKGSLSLTGAIATRGFKEPDFSVLKSFITEETQLRLTLVVLPSGEVKQAMLFETSGYPYVDQKAIELSRKIMFDPLPADWKQVEQSGILTIKLKL